MAVLLQKPEAFNLRGLTLEEIQARWEMLSRNEWADMMKAVADTIGRGSRLHSISKSWNFREATEYLREREMQEVIDLLAQKPAPSV